MIWSSKDPANWFWCEISWWIWMEVVTGNLRGLIDQPPHCQFHWCGRCPYRYLKCYELARKQKGRETSMTMSLCSYVCLYVHMYACLYILADTKLHVCMWLRLCTIYICMYMYVHPGPVLKLCFPAAVAAFLYCMYVKIYVSMFVRMYITQCLYVHIHMYIYICICMCMYTYTICG